MGTIFVMKINMVLDARGAAEPIRFILRYGQIDFEDIRVPITENTIPTIPPEIKSSKQKYNEKTKFQVKCHDS